MEEGFSYLYCVQANMDVFKSTGGQRVGSVLSSTTSLHEHLVAVPLSSLSFNFPICKRRGFKEISARIPFKPMYIKFTA